MRDGVIGFLEEKYEKGRTDWQDQHEGEFAELRDLISAEFEKASSGKTRPAQPSAEGSRLEEPDSGMAATASAASEEVDSMQKAVSAPQTVTVEEFAVIQTKLDDGFRKLNETLQSQMQIQTAAEAPPAPDIIETTIVKTEKDVDESSKKLEEKTAPVLPEMEDSGEEDASSGSGFLSSKQYQDFTLILMKQHASTCQLISGQFQLITDNFKEVGEKLDDINASLNKGKIDWAVVLLVLAAFLVPLFFDKIKGFLAGFMSTFDVFKVISDFINKIEWVKEVKEISGQIWEYVKEKFSKFVEDPFGTIVEKFKTAYTALTTWAKDIWAWVTEKVGLSKKKQEENEKKAEEHATKTTDTAIGKLEAKVQEAAEKVGKNASDQCDKMNEKVSEKSSKINEDVDKMSEDVNGTITKTTDDVNASSQELNEKTLPGLNKELEESVDGAGKKVEDRSDNAIKAADDKLSKGLEKLESDMKEDGAPTNVSKDQLSKMDSAADAQGANLSAPIDQKVNMPNKVAATTQEEQGKTTTLYTNKADVERAAGENAEVQQMMQTTQGGGGGEGQTVNVSNNAQVKQNVSNKLLMRVDGKEDGQMVVYESMDKTLTEVSRNTGVIEEGFAKSRQLLDQLKTKVNEYFQELNAAVKIIADKERPQKTDILLQGNSGNAPGGDNEYTSTF